ncbi:MAG: hypothetical protein U1G07_01925 [Verrucomicrobiota bacterium]
MKRLVITLLAAAGLVFPASATLFEGTISGSVTSVGNPTPILGFAVGGTFSGTYSYESAIVDGTFTPLAGNLHFSFTCQDSTVLTEANVFIPNQAYLTVSGGAVSSLETSLDTSGTRFLTGPIIAKKFGAGNDWGVVDPLGRATVGALVFSAPSAASRAVPDTGHSLALLALGLVGLPFCRRWVK